MQKLESAVTKYFMYLDRRGRIFNTLVGVACTVIVILLDFYAPAGYEFHFLFIVPIAFTTWFAGISAGLLTSLIGTVFLARYHFFEPVHVAVWNVFSTLGVFCIITLLLFKIRELLMKESSLARIDQLTGVMNLRAFKEIAEFELLRLRREGKPFSIAYFDIDDFKQVNDRLGHSGGDDLLKEVVSCFAHTIRRSDVIARIGGDEFVVFFPATDQNSVKVVVRKTTKELAEYSKRTNWPTTVSMGVVTCMNGSCTLNEILSAADTVMYEVKKAGKNNVQYALFPEKGAEAEAA